MCSMFKISKSAYYNWLKSGPSKLWLYNQTLSGLICNSFEDSFRSYGSPRIKVDLEKLGHYVSIPRVARIMSANGLYARRKRKFITTTDSNHNYPIAPNILNRNQSTGSILVLNSKGQPVFGSLCIERGGRNNQKRVSRILAGKYKVVLEWSPRFKTMQDRCKGLHNFAIFRIFLPWN